MTSRRAHFIVGGMEAPDLQEGAVSRQGRLQLFDIGGINGMTKFVLQALVAAPFW